MQQNSIRIYHLTKSCAFVRASDKWGAFSNMGMRFPFLLESTLIKSSEHLYQALKFQNKPSIQSEILDAPNGLESKKTAYKYVKEMQSNRIKIMRFSLFMKYTAYTNYFNDIFEKTRNNDIVEISSKDEFWGTKKISPKTYQGTNALGRLWMEIREQREKIQERNDCFFLLENEIKYTTSVTKTEIGGKIIFPGF